MKYKRQISILLAVALILGCTGWTPATAQQIRKDNTAPSAPEAMNMESLVEDTQILDYVDSEQFLQADHVARLPQEETLDSYVFLNRDGTRSVYYMGRPVKYVDENGTIHEKDTTLVRSTGGYGMRDNDVALHIPDAAATGITLSHNQRSIKLTPQGGSGTAQMADNSIDYVNFFGKGTILRYTPMLSGMKEDIILAEYTGQNSFTFLLETNGLNLYQNQGRYYLAESQDVEATFYLGQIDVYDAIGRPDLGTMTAETIVPGQRYRLTVSADEEFLTDPETVYPVAIDPTLTVRDSEDVRGTLEDTPVFSNYPIRNFGDYTFNSMGYVEGFGTAMTAVRLTGLLADTNYAQLTADQLNSVTFHIKSAGGSYANISVHALTENSTWTEMGLTWNTLGAYSTNSYATQAMGNVLWDAFNITNLAKEWKNGTQNPQCGFVLISDSTTIRTATYGGEYGTIDYRPYVVVNYSNMITLDHTSASVYKGDTLTLSATTIPAGQTVTWESDAPAIASVSDTGVVTGLSKGTATITVTLDAETSATCTVEVLEKTINFGYTADVEVYKGETVTLEPITQPAGEPVTWSSLDPDIATVSNGVVTGVSVGPARIRAELGSDIYAECIVQVLSKSITLNRTSLTVYKNYGATLTATTEPADQAVRWESDDESVVTVEHGVLTTVGLGETTVRAIVDEETYAVCTVEVKMPVLSLNANSIEIAVGETFSLQAETEPLFVLVSFGSNNNSIATVDYFGKVTGVAIGKTFIIASTEKGSLAFCTVNVVEKTVEVYEEGYSNKDHSDVNEGATVQLQAETTPANRAVTWTSSDTSIATVSQTGLVSGIKAGVVTITATMPDGPSANYTVYVTIEDGVYQILNQFSLYYLGVEGAKIRNLQNVQQQTSMASAGGVEYFCQLWKIRYIGNGYYTIRPMHKLDKALDVTIYNVDIYEAFADDTTVPSFVKWTIQWNSTGYVFMNGSRPGYAMRIENGISAVGGNIVVATYIDTLTSYRWILTRQTNIIEGAVLYDTLTSEAVDDPSRCLGIGETKNLAALNLNFYSFSTANVEHAFYWQSDNTDVAIVNSNTGTVTGVSVGTAQITGRVILDSKICFVTFGVCVGYPEMFNTFVEQGYTSYHQYKNTDDGFILCTQPLSQILLSKGVTEILFFGENGISILNTAGYYDDWYLVCVQTEERCSYSLCRMREQEADLDPNNDSKNDNDNDDPGTTVSFVALDMDTLMQCLTDPSYDNVYALSENLQDVISNMDARFDGILATYFANTSAKGAYLLAEEYVQFIASTAENGCLPLPTPCANLYEQIEEIRYYMSISTNANYTLALYNQLLSKQRVLNALADINESAGYTIYDETTRTIYIRDVNNLAYHEKLVILVSHCGNASFNSFAAEVEFHADALYDILAELDECPIMGEWYRSALRSEMGVGEEDESGFYDEYYDLESDMVQAQADAHGAG